VKASPHTFRHQAITWLTRHSGLTDNLSRAMLLAVYQHVALDADLEQKYQQAMRKVDL
jgi:hypothetical protein